jgi:hypothetical protein
MQQSHVVPHPSTRPRALAPWSLSAWPPLLWQAARAGGLQFHHLGTQVSHAGGRAGQTMWGNRSPGRAAGVAWDWIQIDRGIVAMADPLSVVTNLQLVSDDGEVLTAWQSARFLNEIIHTLPWQTEVSRTLGELQ